MSATDKANAQGAEPPSHVEDGHDDVNDLLRHYFGSLEAKDEDIFRLYEDNQRMRDLVEASCAARQELDTRLQTTNLLVASLKTELNEQRCLLEAQESESAAFREGIADLRVILNQPSELDFTIDDCVAEVEFMVKNDRQRQANTRQMIAANDALTTWAMTHLQESEERERTILTEAALTTTRVLVTSAKLAAEDNTRVVALEEAVAVQRSQTHAWQTQQQHALSTTRQEADAVQHDLRQQLHILQCEQQQRQLAHDRLRAEAARTDLCLETASAVVATLAYRAQAAEALVHTLLASSHAAVCRDTARHVAHRAELERGNDVLVEALAHERDTLASLRVQLDKESKARARLDDVEEARRTAQDELETLKVKYTAHLEKTGLQRQRQALVDKKHQEDLASSEEKAVRQTRHAVTLQAELDFNKDALQRARKELRATDTRVADLETQLAESHRALGELDQLMAAQRTTLVTQLAQREQERVFAAEALGRAETATEEIASHAQLVATQAALRSTIARAADAAAVANTYKAELHEWASIAEQAKAHTYQLEQELDRERHVRGLLEAAQCQEMELQKRILWHANAQHQSQTRFEAEQAKEEAAERASTIHSLRQRVRALEETSEASAATIQNLSDALDKARRNPISTPQRHPPPHRYHESAFTAGGGGGGAAGWTSAECALLDRIDRVMDSSSVLTAATTATTPSRVVRSPSDLLS